MEQANVFALITKSTELPDGSLMVRGTATDPSLDSDAQRCDPQWLKSAMPEWFRYGNIREQHSNIAAGVATRYEVEDGDRHVIEARIVDAGSVAKIKAGVLKGFSIGIRNPQIRADKSAPGGVIQNGQIVEISVVDRPANGSCSLTIAKSARPGMTVKADEYDPSSGLVLVSEFHEKTVAPDVSKSPAAAAFGDLATFTSVVEETMAEGATDTAAPAVPAGEGADAGAAVTPEPDDESPAAWEARKAVEMSEEIAARVAEILKREFTARQREAAADSGAAMPDGSFPIKSVEDLKNAIQAIGRAKDPAKARAHIRSRARALGHSDLIPASWTSDKAAMPSSVPASVLEHFSARAAALGVPWSIDKGASHDPAFLATVRNGILACIIAEAREAMNGDDELADMQILMRSLSAFTAWWSCEAAADEVPWPTEVPGPVLTLPTVVDGAGSDDERTAVVTAQDVAGDADLGGLDAIVGDTDLAGGVVLERAADAEVVKSATGCGCCDACTHEPAAVKAADADVVKSTDAEPETPAADVVADVQTGETGEPMTAVAEVTDESAPVAPETAVAADEPATDDPDTTDSGDAGKSADVEVSKTAAPDTVKAAVAEAVKAALQEARAESQAEIDALKARLAQVEKAAAPGGPARRAVQTAPALEKSAEVIALEYQRADLFKTAKGLEGQNKPLAEEFYKRARAVEAQILAKTALPGA